eukprot:JP440145.1.p3 GENE.JP440145.1~~JP440145.1.p3  ORF type:complete len:52 (-),score=4.28 JP440145.1:63-218(-)
MSSVQCFSVGDYRGVFYLPDVKLCGRVLRNRGIHVRTDTRASGTRTQTHLQ